MADTTPQWAVYRDGVRVFGDMETRRDAVACAFDPDLGMSRDELQGLNAEDHSVAGWGVIRYGRWEVKPEVPHA